MAVQRDLAISVYRHGTTKHRGHHQTRRPTFQPRTASTHDKINMLDGEHPNYTEALRAQLV